MNATKNHTSFQEFSDKMNKGYYVIVAGGTFRVINGNVKTTTDFNVWKPCYLRIEEVYKLTCSNPYLLRPHFSKNKFKSILQSGATLVGYSGAVEPLGRDPSGLYILFMYGDYSLDYTEVVNKSIQDLLDEL